MAPLEKCKNKSSRADLSVADGVLSHSQGRADFSRLFLDCAVVSRGNMFLSSLENETHPKRNGHFALAWPMFTMQITPEEEAGPS